MSQVGQVFELKAGGPDGKKLWAYRYRAGGRGSRRVQQGGFESERAAAEALERALGRLRRERGLVEAPRLSELVDVYLAQHGGEPETVAKLRWLLAKAIRVFGHRRVSQLRPAEIAAWRMTIASGHRFEATQALRQVLARAVSWGLIDVNPAKQGVDNPQRRRTEKRPFESWAELDALATKLGPCYGPLVLFAAATGLRPGSGSHSRIATSTATHASSMSVARTGTAGSSARRRKQACGPCRCRRSRSPHSSGCRRMGGRRSCFLRPMAATSTCTTSATATGSPLSSRAGITPLRRVYDLRHTFATFALRAGISTFELSRYMGASLTMIDRHYGHLARDGRQHAIRLLDMFGGDNPADVHAVDAAWTSDTPLTANLGNGKGG